VEQEADTINVSRKIAFDKFIGKVRFKLFWHFEVGGGWRYFSLLLDSNLDSRQFYFRLHILGQSVMNFPPKFLQSVPQIFFIHQIKIGKKREMAKSTKNNKL
jgi:hypothetical protein